MAVCNNVLQIGSRSISFQTLSTKHGMSPRSFPPYSHVQNNKAIRIVMILYDTVHWALE